MSLQRTVSKFNRFNRRLRLPCIGEIDSRTGNITFAPAVAALEVGGGGVTVMQSHRDTAMLALNKRKNRGPTPVKAKGAAARLSTVTV